MARNIVVSKTSDLCLRFANILALPTFCIGDVGRMKSLKRSFREHKNVD